MSYSNPAKQRSPLGILLIWMGFRDQLIGMGHPVGDKLLAMVAKRITANLQTERHRYRDSAHGDEFSSLRGRTLALVQANGSLTRLLQQLSELLILVRISQHNRPSAGINTLSANRAQSAS